MQIHARRSPGLPAPACSRPPTAPPQTHCSCPACRRDSTSCLRSSGTPAHAPAPRLQSPPSRRRSLDFLPAAAPSSRADRSADPRRNSARSASSIAPATRAQPHCRTASPNPMKKPHPARQSAPPAPAPQSPRHTPSTPAGNRQSPTPAGACRCSLFDIGPAHCRSGKTPAARPLRAPHTQLRLPPAPACCCRNSIRKSASIPSPAKIPPARQLPPA